MLAKPAPTDQRAGVRPISFALDAFGAMGAPVTLAVRPEDLTRTEPARATVHQTLGRETVGWVDHFGEGLPSVTISGHTGWRHASGLGLDGAQSFEALNQLVVHDYAQAKQAAIDMGQDPESVKLIFVDLLDSFAWSVVPTQFVLRRSKSRPLLFQYNITLQAVETGVDFQAAMLPNFGNPIAGLSSLASTVSFLENAAASVEGLVSKALSGAESLIAPVAGAVKRFMTSANAVLGAVNRMVRSAQNLVTGLVNPLIGIASDLAKVGTNVFRTISAIKNLPSYLKSELSRLASAYNEIVCIFRNSLRQRSNYDNFEGLYGASNCSSTTGGRMPSSYAGQNVFSLMQPDPSPARLSSTAAIGISAVSRMDPVLAPLPLPEIGRHLDNIARGVMV